MSSKTITQFGRQQLAQEILDFLNNPMRGERSSVQVAAIRELCMEEIYGPDLGVDVLHDYSKKAMGNG